MTSERSEFLLRWLGPVPTLVKTHLRIYFLHPLSISKVCRDTLKEDTSNIEEAFS